MQNSRPRGSRPNLVGWLATMLLIAGLATVADPPGGFDENAPVTIGDAPTPAPGASTRDGTSGATPSPTPSPADDPSEAGEDQPTGTDEPAVAAPSDPESSEQPVAGPQPTPGPTTSEGPDTPEPPLERESRKTYPEAALYEGDGKHRGITDTSLTMCGHAALVAAAAFDTSEEDLNVYWEWVNDNGGVYGREVSFTWEDDAYISSQAVTAAETCAGKNPFMIVGGIGFDQIPGVRNWAEQNRELYFHHMAVAPDKTYNYSFSLQPTVQEMGEQFGHLFAADYADRNIGIIWRDSDNWRPGRDAGVAVMEQRGVAVAADHAVVQNQGVYSQELNDMRVKGVDVVWVWENALNAAQIINQATEQGYRPTWVVFPFQTTLDILRDPSGLEIVGGATWPAYIQGGYGDDWSAFGLPSEIELFEEVYAEYRPDSTPNEILFMVWNGFKVMHQMLLDCGPDCNRNRFAGMMLSGYEADVKPMCPFSFSGPGSFGGHHGVSPFFEQRLFQLPSGRPAFETSRYCTPTLG